MPIKGSILIVFQLQIYRGLKFRLTNFAYIDRKTYLILNFLKYNLYKKTNFKLNINYFIYYYTKVS